MMKTAQWLACLLILSPINLASAQFPENQQVGDVDGSIAREDRIETDRDSFTPSTRVVGFGRAVFESAYTFQDNRRVKETHSFPELLLRLGVTKRIEFRLGWNYEIGGSGSDTTGSDADSEGGDVDGGLVGKHRILYGIKVALTEQEGLIPNSAIIVQGFTPTGGNATASQLVATWAVGWELPNRWTLDTALRYATASEEGDGFDVWAPSLVVKVPVLDRWNVHAEYFGLFSRSRHRDFQKHYFSPGVHYLLTDNFEIGTRVGWGLNDESTRFFCNVGVGLRF